MNIPGKAKWFRETLIDATAPTTGDCWQYDGTEWHLVPWTEMDGDILDISGTPAGYTPNATSPAADVDDLWAHLLGISDKFVATDAILADQSPDVEGVAGETLDQYETVYLADDETWYLAKTGGTEAESVGRGTVTESGGIAAAATGTIRRIGAVTNGAWSWTPGARLYLSDTYGALTETETSAQMGYAEDATTIWFAPGSGSGAAGFIETLTAGEALAFAEVVYANASDSGEYWLAQSDGTEAEADACAIVVESAGIADGSTGRLCFAGIVENAGWSWTPGTVLWLDAVAGTMTETEPTTGFHKPLGHAITATKILFLPQTGWATPLTVAEGDLLVGNASLTWETLAAGTAGSIIYSTSGSPAWNSNFLVYADGAFSAGGSTYPMSYDPDDSILNIIGKWNDLAHMPRIHYKFAGDDDAAIGYVCYTHDHIVQLFDAWHNGSNWISSDVGSNFSLYKYQNHLIIGFASGYAKGSPFTFDLESGVGFTADGAISVGRGFAASSTYGKFEAYSNVTGATPPVGKFHQDHASNTGILIKGVHDGSGTLLDLERGTTNDATGGVIKLTRLRGGSAGTDDSVLWGINFYGANDAGTPETIQYAEIATGISDASDGTEGGSIALKVADGVDGSLDTMIEVKSNKIGVYGVTPVVRAAHIGDPAGGATVDAEARTAINSILVVLENVGLTLTA